MMDIQHERVIIDWISSTEDAITALQSWLDSLRKWHCSAGKVLAVK